MSNTKLIRSFLMIAVAVSVALAYLGAIFSPWQGLQASSVNLLFAPLMLAPFYAIFVLLGGTLFGVPTLIVLRKLGLAQNRTALVTTGMFVGAVCGALLLGLWLGLAVLTLGVSFGAAGGAMSALLWYEVVESKSRHD